jgi:hypothetical protein
MSLDIYRWGDKQRLKKEHRKLTSEHSALLVLMVGNEKEKNKPENQTKLIECRTRLKQVESALLLLKANDLGVEYPTQSQKPEWWTSDESEPYLSEQGRIGIRKLIRDERRQNIDWWVKTVTPLVGALISLIGLIVALVTVLKN